MRKEPRIAARFVEPMLLLPAEKLPDGESWVYEVKLDGFRALAFKSAGRVYLRSRSNKDFSRKYPDIVQALAGMPDETLIDGEIVALDETGRPSFHALQNYDPGAARIVYYAFDVVTVAGVDVSSRELQVRRELLRAEILPSLAEPVRESPELEGSLTDLIHSVKAHGLEGLVAKRRNSSYESGRRTGAWQKMRVNRWQDFVIAGYTIGPKSFDALIFGYYDGSALLYAGRTRNGFTPLSRGQIRKRFESLETGRCPFANLPEAAAGRWGQGLTAEKMAECRWLQPVLIARFEFLEWTPDNHLRHVRFVRLIEGNDPKTIRRKV